MSELAPMISVIIPTYNRAYLLRRAINSVLRQSFSDFELIVVDDASEDTTKSVVASFQDRRIRYIRHATNQNGARSRNTGIQNALGEFVAFLDSDDEWVETKLECQLARLQGLQNGDLAVCYSQLIVQNGVRSWVLPQRGISDNEAVGDYLFVSNGLMQTSAIMLPRALAQEVMFSPGLSRHQDWDFCIRLAQHGARFIFIDAPLATWHVDDRTDRVSTRNEYKSSLAWLSTCETILSKRARGAFLARRVAPLAFKNGEKMFAVETLVRGLTSGGISIYMFVRLLAKALLPNALLRVRRRSLGWK